MHCFFAIHANQRNSNLIRAYAKAIVYSYDSNEMDAGTTAWIEWAMKKTDWFDPTVARADEFFGERENEKSQDQKVLKKIGQYWRLDRLH